MLIQNALKEQRIEAGYTLQYVEKHTGISNQNLSRWENGKAIPGADFCITLAKFYGCSLDELLGLDSYEKPQNNNSLPAITTNAVSFIKEYEDIIPDKNFVTMAKLYKEITPELRALTLGYIIGVLQNNGIDTKKILGY